MLKKIQQVAKLEKQLDEARKELQSMRDKCDHLWDSPREVTIVRDSYRIPSIGFGPFLHQECKVPVAKETVWVKYCINCGETRETRITFQNQNISEPSDTGDCLFSVMKHFGQRNLTRLQKSYSIGKVYNTSKAQNGGDRRSSDAMRETKNEDTASYVSRRFHVSPASVRRYAQLAQAIDELTQKHGEDVINLLLAPRGKVRIESRSILALFNLPTKYQGIVVNDLRRYSLDKSAEKTSLQTLVKIQQSFIEILGETGRPIFVEERK